MTPTIAARLLELTPAGVRAAIRRGAIPGVRVLGRWRVDPSAVEALSRGIPSPLKDAADHAPPATPCRSP